MAELYIRDPLAARLRALAQSENKSVDEVLETMLDQYDRPQGDNADVDDPLLRILEMVEQADLKFSSEVTSENSREILETEYAEYLLKRMRGEDADE